VLHRPVPAQISDIAYQNKAVIYDLLFKAASETVLTIAADPKHLSARIGITAARIGIDEGAAGWQDYPQ
jgi:hypothetical protein